MKKVLIVLASSLLILSTGCVATTTNVPDQNQTGTVMVGNIVDVAVADGQFKTLATALTEADLVNTLKGTGPFTVFAPTDAAFAKLPKEALDNLLKNKEELKRVLLYHVVSGNVMAQDVVKLQNSKTVEGSDIKIAVTGEKVMINESLILKTDVKASNGTIHVIDTVLMPPKK